MVRFALRSSVGCVAASPQEVKSEVTLLFASHGPGGYDVRPCLQSVLHHHVKHTDRSLQLDAPELLHYAGKQPFGD